MQSVGDMIQGQTRTADLIANTLVDEIRSQRIAVDEVLPSERELCARFDASRPTVREALSQLQLRGYLNAGGGKRPRASLPSLAEILRGAGDVIRDVLGDTESDAHLEQTRHFIETGAVREAAMRADHLQIAQIRSALEDNFRTIGTSAFPQTDIAFHRSIVSVVGNPIILTLHDLFVSDMLARRPPETDRQAHDEMVYEEHRQIYEAVLGGDVIAATDVMDRHLARSYRYRLAMPRSLLAGSTDGPGPNARQKTDRQS
ncbi:MAG: FCD domain-containing protein [Geminicoccaceae bacterium]